MPMSTAFTHAFVAGSLGALAPRAAGRRRLVVALAVVAVVPDVDVVGFDLGVAYGQPLGHRGLTHSLLFAALLGLATATLLFRRLGVGSRAWLGVAGLLMLGAATHGALDALTDAGLGVGFLLPFSEQRFFAPWRPLATSPLGVGAFFDGPALAILGNELLWVWLPVGGLLSTCLAMRWVRRRSATVAPRSGRY